ncbi:hypothetical protein ACHAXS_005351 [Conticribra weissflogii]
MKNSVILLVILVISIGSVERRSVSLAAAFAPAPIAPLLGIGAILFRPRNIKIVKSGGDEDRLTEAGKFFVDAFWTSKIGGADKLSPRQAQSIERLQIAEFKKRYKSREIASGTNLPGAYAGRTSDVRSELILCVNGKGETIGCAGIEVEKIKKMDGYDGSMIGPLMSNLAIGRQYRRKGLAEDLVRAAENVARKEWGYDDCFLYVEKRNTPAIKLYQKLGYRTIWEDPSSTTLLPTPDGRIKLRLDFKNSFLLTHSQLLLLARRQGEKGRKIWWTFVTGSIMKAISTRRGTFLPPVGLRFQLTAFLLTTCIIGIFSFQQTQLSVRQHTPSTLGPVWASVEDSSVSTSESAAVLAKDESNSKPCYYKRIDGSWKPRKELQNLFIGERLFGRRLAECDLLNGKSGPKVFFECGIGKKNSQGKWSIVNGMLRLGKRGMKDSVVRKKMQKLPSDDLIEVYVSKISLDHGSFEVCLTKEDALERSSRKKKIPASSFKPGQELTGQVTTLTPYGVFVDVGANRNGLLHIKNIARYQNKFVNREEGLKKIGLSRGTWVSVVVLNNENKRLELDLTPKVEDVDEQESVVVSSDNETNSTYEISEEEALAWASYGTRESNDGMQYGVSDEEAAMWAAYGSGNEDDGDDYDEDRDIEDSLGIGYY